MSQTDKSQIAEEAVYRPGEKQLGSLASPSGPIEFFTLTYHFLVIAS